MSDKPNTIDEYVGWLKKEHNVQIAKPMRTHFRAVADKVQKDFEGSAFWREFPTQSRLKDFDERYKQLHDGYPLVMSHDAPELKTKLFDSFLLKTFRQNVIRNDRWPKPPAWPNHEPVWLLPENWLGRVNDIVRACFVVKYLDGVRFLIDKIEELCNQHGLSCKNYFRSGEDGYYAAHFYIRQRFEIPKITFDTEHVEIEIELQVTTQLQDVIRRLLHVHYEARRKQQPAEDKAWQWEYKSDEFATNYLGHILHYAEGMIVEVRDRQKEHCR